MEAILISLVIITTLILVILYNSIIWGFVCYKFYYWFILPIFHTANVTYYQCIGLMLFISLFKNNHSSTNKEEKVNWGLMLFQPIFSLLIGWLLYLLFIKHP